MNHTASDIHLLVVFFFFNDTATTEIYTLSLHDALPISVFQPLLKDFRHLPKAYCYRCPFHSSKNGCCLECARSVEDIILDRKSTRLNSSHANISYAVFCLKKKKNKHTQYTFDHLIRHDT